MLGEHLKKGNRGNGESSKNLVCGHGAIRIAHFPPPLMPYDRQIRRPIEDRIRDAKGRRSCGTQFQGPCSFLLHWIFLPATPKGFHQGNCGNELLAAQGGGGELDV